MTSPHEIIKRLEAASGPDRELDAIIASIDGLNFTWCDFDAGSYHGDCRSPGCGGPLGLVDERSSYPADWRDDTRLPAYTASIDAAVAFAERVRPNARVIAMSRTSAGWGAGVDGHVVMQKPVAIALLLALFRSIGEDNG